MTRHQEMAFGLAVSIAVFFVLCVSAASAAPATVTGVVTSPTAGPPSPKNSQTNVLAMNVDSGIYGDADTANGKGAYSLKLPAGKWALLTSFLEPGKRAASFLSAAIVAKSGQKRSMPPLTLKQFKKPRKRKRHKKRHHKQPTAKVSNVNPRDGRPYDGEAYAVKEFDAVGGGDIAILGRGMDDIVITDIVGSSECKFTVVEWTHRDLIEKEINL
jgi:hypothetical protein